MKSILITLLMIFSLISAKNLPREDVIADSLRQKILISDKLTLQQGVKNKNRTAIFIDRFLKWTVTDEKNPKLISDKVNRRVESFTSTKKYQPGYAFSNIAGNRKAPVTIYIYITGSCLECLLKADELYKEVTTGSLKNKTKLIAVPFKVDLPEQYLLMADKQGKFWQYLQNMSKIEERYTPEIMENITKDCNLDQKQLKKDLADQKNLDFLQNASKEAANYGIKISSTMLIDNKMYNSYKTLEWIRDAVEYFTQTSQGR